MPLPAEFTSPSPQQFFFSYKAVLGLGWSSVDSICLADTGPRLNPRTTETAQLPALAISELGRQQGQGNKKFWVILRYISSWRLIWNTGDPDSESCKDTGAVLSNYRIAELP